MLYDGYNAWDECPEADDCELIRSFLKLVDAMVRYIQHLKADAFCGAQRTSMRFRADAVRSITDALKRLLLSVSFWAGSLQCSVSLPVSVSHWLILRH